MKSVLPVLALAVLLGSGDSRADEQLPRVLIIGDRVYQQPAKEVKKELKAKVDVVYATLAPDEVRNSETLLQDLDRLLGDGPWDLIHFNVGLGDLVYRAPGMKSFRVLPRQVGGVRCTSVEQYEKNLRQLCDRLLATEARVVWASTTPIRHSSTNVFELGSEVTYNKAAKRVMAEKKIPVNDMYQSVRDLIDMDRPASHGADPFFFDRKPIHSPIVEIILTQLDLR